MKQVKIYKRFDYYSNTTSSMVMAVSLWFTWASIPSSAPCSQWV